MPNLFGLSQHGDQEPPRFSFRMPRVRGEKIDLLFPLKEQATSGRGFANASAKAIALMLIAER